MTAKLCVAARVLHNGALFIAKGRDGWALLQLIAAGTRGCTPLDTPGPRWSAYVHALRRECGLDIETRHEAHNGPFPGNHARYVLRSDVEIISRSDQPEARAA